MKLLIRTGLAALTISSMALLLTRTTNARPADEQHSLPAVAGSKDNISATVKEARDRARLLHEIIHGTLQVMHRDFFDPDELDKIPSASLEDVFNELARKQGVKVHWLGVDGQTMNIEHQPQDNFEREAVKAISSGKKEFEAVEGNRYRHAGAIVLHNVCLKCHVPNRSSLEDRAAGLVISMKFGKD
jgi:hypothetical protein